MPSSHALPSHSGECGKTNSFYRMHSRKAKRIKNRLFALVYFFMHKLHINRFAILFETKTDKFVVEWYVLKSNEKLRICVFIPLMHHLSGDVCKKMMDLHTVGIWNGINDLMANDNGSTPDTNYYTIMGAESGFFVASTHQFVVAPVSQAREKSNSHKPVEPLIVSTMWKGIGKK